MNTTPAFITSTDNNKSKGEISIYPNPFQMTACVTVHEKSSYEIWSIKGLLVESGTITNQGFIGLTLERGSFVLKIISDLETTTTTITKS